MTPPPPAFPPPAPGYGGYGAISPPTDGMAIASLVLGIVAFPSICCYGVPAIAFGITALVLGRVSLRKIRAANGMLGGRGLAQAGWICGLIAAVLAVLVWGIYLLFIVLSLTGTINLPSFSPTPAG
jgi:hypothetical protein